MGLLGVGRGPAGPSYRRRRDRLRWLVQYKKGPQTCAPYKTLSSVCTKLLYHTVGKVNPSTLTTTFSHTRLWRTPLPELCAAE